MYSSGEVRRSRDELNAPHNGESTIVQAGQSINNVQHFDGTAIAVQFGVSSSDTTGRTAQGAYLDNVSIFGFNQAYDLESQAWNITVNHSNFNDQVTNAIFLNPNAANSGENLAFIGTTISNSMGVWTANAVDLQLGSAITTFVSSNFDNSEVVCGPGTCNLTNPYFENPAGTSPVLRATPWIMAGGVMTITGLTAADDDTTTPATQPSIVVPGTLTWIGGTIFGEAPATATVVTTSGGHAWVGGDIDISNAVPQLLNNSGLPFVNLERGNPTFGSQAVQAINPAPTTADHWYNLEQTDGGVTYDVFLEQLGSNDPNNPNGFEIASQESTGGTFFNPLQIDPTGGHVGLHGVPDTAVNNHLYGTNELDHITNGTGIQSFAVPVCAITAGAVGNICNVTITFASASPAGVPEPDAAYRVTCQAVAGSGLWTVGNISSLTATSFVIPAVALSTTATATGGSIHCTLTHQ